MSVTNSGNGNTTVTVPGNNNSVTISPSQPKPDGSAEHPVARKEDCPLGTQVFFQGAHINDNGGYGADISKDVRACFIDTEVEGNKAGGVKIH